MFEIPHQSKMSKNKSAYNLNILRVVSQGLGVKRLPRKQYLLGDISTFLKFPYTQNKKLEN